MPVEEFTLRTLQDCFRKRRGTGTEVIGSLAHIQSHSDLVGLQSCQQRPRSGADICGSWLACDSSAAVSLNDRGACIAGKPAPTWTASRQRALYFIRDKQQGGESSSAPCVSAYSCGSSSSAAASRVGSSTLSSPAAITSPSNSSPSSSSPSTSEGSCTRSRPTSFSSLASLIRVTP